MGPLPPLGLQGCTRDSPALPLGSQGTPSSFSSSSSSDGDLDFQTPERSQGHRPGKGELAGLRLGVGPGEGRGAALPTTTRPIRPVSEPGLHSRYGCKEQTCFGGQGSVLVTWLRRGRTTPKISRKHLMFLTRSIKYFLIPASKKAVSVTSA